MIPRLSGNLTYSSGTWMFARVVLPSEMADFPLGIWDEHPSTWINQGITQVLCRLVTSIHIYYNVFIYIIFFYTYSPISVYILISSLIPSPIEAPFFWSSYRLKLVDRFARFFPFLPRASFPAAKTSQPCTI